MRHVVDDIGFHQRFAVGVPPGLSRVAVDDRLGHGLCRKIVQVEPLLDDLVGIAGIDGAVGAAVPHRDPRPGSAMVRGTAHEIAEFALGPCRGVKHAVQRLAQIRGDAIGQAGDHRTGRKHLRIGREHHRGHAAAGGQAGDEDAPGVDAMRLRHVRDHLADRTGLAAVPRGVFRIEPVEAGVGVVGPLLLGHQKRKAVMARQHRPSRAEIVAGRGLAAAVQHDDERARLLQLRRHEGEHAQIAGIVAERGDLLKRAGGVGAAEFGEAQAVQPQASQEIDVSGERHGNSWQATFNVIGNR